MTKLINQFRTSIANFIMPANAKTAADCLMELAKDWDEDDPRWVAIFCPGCEGYIAHLSKRCSCGYKNKKRRAA